MPSPDEPNQLNRPKQPFFVYYVPGGTARSAPPDARSGLRRSADITCLTRDGTRYPSTFFQPEKARYHPTRCTVTAWRMAGGVAVRSWQKWETLSDDEKKMFIPASKRYAGLISPTPTARFGRVIQRPRHGQLDNTLIHFHQRRQMAECRRHASRNPK